MNIAGILLIISILVLLYYILRYIINDVHTLTGITSGTTMQTIEPSTLAIDKEKTNNSNFTYSIWFYVNDWNYKYGEDKVIFGRMGNNSASAATTTSSSANEIDLKEPCPSVVLGPLQNNLDVSLAVYPGADQASLTSDDIVLRNVIIHHCNVSNIPIQKWVNLLISVYGRTLDVYLDGKLVKTCVLPGIAKINQDASVYVTPNGGFAGWTGKFQYFPNATNPQQAWDIYKKGYGKTFLSSIFGNYQVKVSFVENGNENASFTI